MVQLGSTYTFSYNQLIIITCVYLTVYELQPPFLSPISVIRPSFRPHPRTHTLTQGQCFSKSNHFFRDSEGRPHKNEVDILSAFCVNRQTHTHTDTPPPPHTHTYIHKQEHPTEPWWGLINWKTPYYDLVPSMLAIKSCKETVKVLVHPRQSWKIPQIQSKVNAANLMRFLQWRFS